MADVVTVSAWIMWMLWGMFIGAAVLAAMFGIMLFILSYWTPAWSFFKSKLKGQPLLAARRRDRKIDYHRAENYIEGLAVSEKYNSGYIIDPESVYTEKKSGVAVLPVNSEIGITLSPRVLRIIDGLKRMGFHNIEEATAYNMQWGQCDCGYEGMMDFKKDDKGKPIILEGQLTLICPMERKDEEKEARSEEDGLSDKSTGTDV